MNSFKTHVYFQNTCVIVPRFNFSVTREYDYTFDYVNNTAVLDLDLNFDIQLIYHLSCSLLIQEEVVGDHCGQLEKHSLERETLAVMEETAMVVAVEELEDASLLIICMVVSIVMERGLLEVPVRQKMEGQEWYT